MFWGGEHFFGRSGGVFPHFPPPLPTYGLESVELKLQELFVVLVHVAVEDEGSRGREDAVACCVIAVGQGGIRAIFVRETLFKRRAPKVGSTEPGRANSNSRWSALHSTQALRVVEQKGASGSSQLPLAVQATHS